MARDKFNGAAYDLSLFEPQKKVENTQKKKKKDSNLIRLNTKKSVKALRRKRNPAMIAGIAAAMVLAAGVGSWIVCNNVMLNELSQNITDAQNSITHQNNLQEDYQARIDNHLTPSKIQEYAEKKLGMSQIKNAQKKFISLSDGDLGEVIRDDGTNTILDFLSGMFSES